MKLLTMAMVVGIVVGVLISVTMADISFSNESSCIESEKHALLMFKQHLIDRTSRLASWAPDAEDCRRWIGVVCDNTTGHVVELRLGLPLDDSDTDDDSYQRTKLEGKINPCLSNLKHLRYLDLSNNAFEGMLPYQLGNLSNLRTLNLGHMGFLNVENLLWLSALSLLKYLDLSFVNLSSASNWLHVVNSLPSLEELYLSGCGLSLIPPFPFPNVNNLSLLTVLDLSFNYLGNVQLDFGWVSNLNSLTFLDLQSNDFHGPIPDVLYNMSTSLRHLDLSENYFNSSMPDWLYNLSVLEVLRIANNLLQGEISSAFGNMTYFDENGLSVVASNYHWIDLSGNYLWGSLFHLLCYQLNHTMRTEILILTQNLLSGQIPDCWIKWPNLVILRLDDNRFTGRIPTSIGTLGKLQSLNLCTNSLYGEIPLSLKSCRYLESIKFGENQLEGNIPGWLGHSFPNLLILSLRVNRLSGKIPDDLCQIRSLQIFDLADNTLSGYIPRCMYNFSAMAEKNNGSMISYIEYDNYFNLTEPAYETATVIMKGQPLKYSSTLNLVRVVDLSSNNLSGEIPHEVTSLQALQSLNLSHNNLTGKIPENIGAMQSLESLDLSLNRLSGSIPPSMSSMTFLSRLNLSYNNLTGQIPPSTQLQSFNASSYGGNNLCGPPLKDCIESGIIPNSTGNEEKRFKVEGLYISMALGFIVGFWSTVAPLAINRRWMFTYYEFLERMRLRLHDFFKV